MPERRSLTVLVLGVGGNVSQGILKALAAASLPCRVLAGCISPLSLGLYFADGAFVTPRADDVEFIPWLERTCRDEHVDAVLSGTELVLEVLAPHVASIRDRTGALCIVSPPDVLEVGQDKLRTAGWLHGQGLSAPRSADASSAEAVRALAAECGLPLVAKPRRGKGATGILEVCTDEDLKRVSGRADLVIQERLGTEDAEFTVGCVCDVEGESRGILAMKRELQAGTTYRAQAGEFPAVSAYVEQIAQALRPTGPLNVQLRLVDETPVAFDLNVRFSGTTPARARLGFNEVEAVLRHFVLGEPLRLPRVTQGTLLRYWNEAYIPPGARDRLSTTGRLEDPRADPPTVEDWGMRP